MTAKSIYFKCPVCTSIFSLEAKAVRSETFRCPVCQEGEIESGTAEPETGQIAMVLLGEPESWVVLPAPMETVSWS